MIYNLYSIEDVCSGYGNPVMVVKEELAKREFKNRCKKDLNPEDLRLWKVGEFNLETGEINANKPELIMKGETNEMPILNTPRS